MYTQGKEFFDILFWNKKWKKKEKEEKSWTGRDLNPEPSACKADDLPLIYRPDWLVEYRLL